MYAYHVLNLYYKQGQSCFSLITDVIKALNEKGNQRGTFAVNKG